MLRRYVILLSLLLWGAAVAVAQNSEQSTSDKKIIERKSLSSYGENLQTLVIQYQHNKAWPCWDYANNRAAYNELVKVIKRLGTDSDAIRTVFIEGSASPIGSDKYNKDLSERRATILKNIISKLKGGNNINIYTSSKGEDWATFAAYIRQEYHRANREAVLAIVESEDSNNEKERRLQALDKGKTWRILVCKYMAPARNAVVVHIVRREQSVDMLDFRLEASVKAVEEPMLIFEQREVSVESEIFVRKPIFALRTNLLVPALNVGAEVPIGDHWSLGADYYYPWAWPKSDNKNCFELLGWGLEGRYWFGRNRNFLDRLQGHSLGLYGYAGYYDFEYNFHGYQGEFINVGVDYTFAKAVGRKRSVHFEFTLGVGYIYSQARKYTVVEAGSPLFSDKITKKVEFIGPTKASVSLVVPIFQRVYQNGRRGGRDE